MKEPNTWWTRLLAIIVALLISFFSSPAHAYTFEFRDDFETDKGWHIDEEIVGGNTCYDSGIGAGQLDTAAAFEGSKGYLVWANKQKAFKSNHVIGIRRFTNHPKPDTVHYEFHTRMLSDSFQSQSGPEFSVQVVSESTPGLYLIEIIGVQYLPQSDSWNIWDSGTWVGFMNMPLSKDTWYKITLKAEYGMRRYTSLRVEKVGGGLDTTTSLTNHTIAPESRGQTFDYTDISLEAENKFTNCLADTDNRVAFDSILFQIIVPDTIGANAWYVNDGTHDANDSFTQAVGSDNNDGLSPSTPFLTLEKAFGKLTWGDTIYIDAGTFTPAETLTIAAREVKIIGVDSGRTIINFGDSTTSANRGIHVKSRDDATISDLHVTNAYAGVRVQNSKRAKVSRVKSSSSQFGFLLDVAESGVYEANFALQNSTTGFHLGGSDSNVLIRGRAEKGLVGFVIATGSDTNVIHTNHAVGNASDGFQVLSNSDTNRFFNNHSVSNIGLGFSMTSGRANVFDSNSINDGSGKGFFVSASSNVLHANRVSDPALWCYELNGASDLVLTENTADSCTGPGFFFFGAIGASVIGNTAYRTSQEGFLVRDTTTGSRFLNNQARGNTWSGFSIHTGADSNLFEGNVVETNGQWGFRVQAYSDSLDIRRNLVRNNGRTGISIEGARSIRIEQNTLDSNGTPGYFGIEIDAATAECTAVKNNLTPSPGETNAVKVAIANVVLARNYWNTVDSGLIRGRIVGAGAQTALYAPFRFGFVDTASGADTVAPKAPDTLAAATANTTTIRVTWSTVSLSEEPEAALGLAGYRIYRSPTSDTMLWQLRGLAGPTGQSFDDSGNASGESFFYRVTAIDGASPNANESFHSDSVVFGTTVDTHAPSQPVLQAPVDGHETRVTSFVFLWTAATDTGSGVSGYRLQADTSSLFVLLVADSLVTGTSETLSLRENDTYYWRVIAIDNNGNTTVSESRVVKVDTLPPTLAVHSSPSPGLETRGVVIAFSWNASADSISGVAGHRLQIDTAGSFSAPVIDSTTGLTAAGTVTLSANDTYYWRVFATDDAGNTSASAGSLLIIDTLAPTAAVPLNPPGGSETNLTAIAFSWTQSADSVAGVASYRLQVDTSGAFLAPVADSSTSTNLTGVLSLAANETYHWRLLATDDAGNTSVSAPVSFKTDTRIGVSLMSPDSGAVKDSRPVFQWADTSTETFVWQISMAAGFATIKESTTLSVSLFQPAGLESGLYYWRVGAHDNATNAETTAGRLIRIDTAIPDTTPPDAFSLLFPPSGSETRLSELTYRWSLTNDTGTGVAGYTVQIDTPGGGFLSPVDSVAVGATVSETALRAAGTETYVWRVIARDASGNTTVSETRIILVDTTPPAEPALVAPSHAAETTAVSLAFAWSAAVDVHSAVNRYHLQVDTSGAFTSLLFDSVTSTNVSGVITLPANDTYRWRVVAYDDAGNTAATADSRFAIDTLGPTMPLPLTPLENAETNVTTMTFTWQGSIDSIAGVALYRIQIDTLGTFVNLVSDSTAGLNTTGSVTLAGNASYRWRILAVDDLGNTSASTDSSFRIDTEAPNAAVLTGPTDGLETTATQIRFSWNASADSGTGLLSYVVEIDTSGGGFKSTLWSIVVESTVTETTVSLAGTDTFVWRVVVHDRSGNTTPSNARTFLIDTSPPEVPMLLLPLAGGETFAETIRFDWTDVFDTGSGLRDYRIQIARNDSTFTAPVVDSIQSSVSETAPYFSFVVLDAYWWRVIARDDAGNTTASVTALFRRVAAETAVPLSVRNLVATSLETGAILLTWDKSLSPDVTRYKLLWDSGAGGSTDTLLTTFDSGSTSYSHVAISLVSGKTYTFRVIAVDSALNQDSGAVASALATADTPRVASVVILSPGSGGKLAVGDSAAQVIFAISGTATRQSAISTITFQYRAIAETTYASVVAASGITNNANPTTLAKALDDFGNYRFVWNASGLAIGDYQFRAFVTDTGGDSGMVRASAVGIRIVDPSTDSPSQTAVRSETSYNFARIINKDQAETLLVTNNGDTQSAMIILPPGAFASAADTANVMMRVSISNAPRVDTTIGGKLLAIGDAVEVTLSNGETRLTSGSAEVVITFADRNRDGLVDGTRIRWGTLAVYTHSGLPGGSWERLSTATMTDPSADTPGWIKATTTHFSVFMLVGVSASANLADFMVAPNPYRPNDGDMGTGQAFNGAAGTGVYFLNLPPRVRITVYTVAGAKVTEFSTTDSTGQIQWNVRNEANRDIASGVYIYVIEDLSNGERRAGKLAVIR